MESNLLLKNQKGVALIIALIMLLVLTLLGLSAVSTTTHETKIAGNGRVYNNAFYAADGGIENFRGRASTGEFVYGVATSGSYSLGIGEATSNVSYKRWKRSESGIDYAVFRVSSEGVAPNFPTAGKVKIEAIIEVAMMTQEGYN
ncbi:MAG: PilX N-terminal domain-containing pilus assembly protein [Thermodesulfobacteriota bacterium]